MGRKIAKLESELKDVRRVRATQRERRIKNEVPVVAIVGYTNAGKSTLLNALTGAGIPANNRLFDTLDTTTRTLEISDTCTVLISDTVGFISKLPHQLVDAFKATLEELTFADLLVHVIDASGPNWREQAAVVDRLIQELGAAGTPRLEVFNKCDKFVGDILPHGEDMVSVSAKTGAGLDALLAAIGRRLDAGARRVELRLPYGKGAAGPALPGGQGGEGGLRRDHRGHRRVHAQDPGADGGIFGGDGGVSGELCEMRYRDEGGGPADGDVPVHDARLKEKEHVGQRNDVRCGLLCLPAVRGY